MVFLGSLQSAILKTDNKMYDRTFYCRGGLPSIGVLLDEGVGQDPGESSVLG